MRFIELGQKGNNKITSVFITLSATIFVFFIVQVATLFIAISLSNSQGISVDLNTTIDQIGANTFLAIQLIPFAFALLTLVFCVKFIHKRSIRSLLTSRELIDWRRFFLSALVWTGIMGINLFFAFRFSDNIEWNFNLQSFLPLCLISLILIPIQTTCEEVLFRGYLLQFFGSSYKKTWLAILLSAVLFGLVHAGNPEIDYLGYVALLYYILTAIFLSLLTVMDEGLELSMGFHAANNIFGALILTNDWQAFQTDAIFIDYSKPVFGVEMILSLLLIQPLLLLLYARLYKWNNWKKKLFSPLNEAIS